MRVVLWDANGLEIFVMGNVDDEGGIAARLAESTIPDMCAFLSRALRGYRGIRLDQLDHITFSD